MKTKNQILTKLKKSNFDKTKKLYLLPNQICNKIQNFKVRLNSKTPMVKKRRPKLLGQKSKSQIVQKWKYKYGDKTKKNSCDKM